jgi:hypothetical protein
MRRAGVFTNAAEQNASALALYLGKTGVLRCEYLSVDVTIADAKRSYGRTLLLVRPIAGAGEQWVEEGRVRRISEGGG